jgi:hypothetical protein
MSACIRMPARMGVMYRVTDSALLKKLQCHRRRQRAAQQGRRPQRSGPESFTALHFAAQQGAIAAAEALLAAEARVAVVDSYGEHSPVDCCVQQLPVSRGPWWSSIRSGSRVTY